MVNFSLWNWKAIDEQGQRQQGTMLADNSSTATEALLAQHLQLLSLRKSSRTSRGCWHIQQKIQLFRQLATLLQAGIPLADSLTLMAKQHPLREWRALLERIEQQVSHGIPFSDTLRQWPRIFPPSS